MNLAELITSFRAQGFDYLTDAECTTLLNDSYLIDVCESEDWSFLEEVKEGKAPLEITDLRSIESVIDATQMVKLIPLDRRALTDEYDTDLSTPGSPAFYYLSKEKTVSVFPTSTADTLSVRYWKAPEALSGEMTPLLPSRFHSLIVDGAKARGYENSDDWELATNARETFLVRLARMVESLMGQIRDRPPELIVWADSGTDA
jgi:hypothetical protein